MPIPRGALTKIKRELLDSFELAKGSPRGKAVEEAVDAGYDFPVVHAATDIEGGGLSRNPHSLGVHVDPTPSMAQAVSRMEQLYDHPYSVRPGILTMLMRASRPILARDYDVNSDDYIRMMRGNKEVDSFIYPNLVEGFDLANGASRTAIMELNTFLKYASDEEKKAYSKYFLDKMRAARLEDLTNLRTEVEGEFPSGGWGPLSNGEFDPSLYNPSIIAVPEDSLLNVYGDKIMTGNFSGPGYRHGGEVDALQAKYLEPIFKAAGVEGGCGCEHDCGHGGYQFEPTDPNAAFNNYAKGGSVRKARQWLDGVVENALGKFKSTFGGKSLEELIRENEEGLATGNYKLSPEELNRQRSLAHLNKWIDSNLTNYVKRDYGSEWDPMREFDPEEGWEQEMARRLSTTSNPARYYQEMKDYTFAPDFRANPWIEKLDPEELIFSDFNSAPFNHLIDELKNSVRPDSDLPRELRLRPESLSRLSFPDASRLVGKIDAWRQAQKIEANQALANNSATHLIKEYPEGFRWVELKRPEEIDFDALEKYKKENAPQPGAWRPAVDPTDEQIWEDMTIADLENALAYEGDVMGHCVGGYCDDVVDGASRIFSLRDAKGEPHVTIEVKPPSMEFPVSGEDFARLDLEQKAKAREAVMQWRRRNPEIEELTDEHTATALKEAGWTPKPPSIIQVKGKGNKKPADKYIPMVQDFLIEKGWPIERDFENTGFMREIDLLRAKFGSPLHNSIRGTEDTDSLFKALGRKYGTEEELLNKARELWPDRFQQEDFAEGGVVKSKGKLRSAFDRLVQLRNAAQSGFDTQWMPDEEGALGIALATESMPELLELFKEGAAPDWSVEAGERYDKHLDEMLRRHGLPPSEDLTGLDRFGVAFGEMAGQIPVPGAMLRKLEGLRKLPGFAKLLESSPAKATGAVMEYFSPSVGTNPTNYMIGTGVGGTFRQLDVPEESPPIHNYARGGAVF